MEKFLEERQSGEFHGREQAKPFFFLATEQAQPAVELFEGDLETFTEFF